MARLQNATENQDRWMELLQLENTFTPSGTEANHPVTVISNDPQEQRLAKLHPSTRRFNDRTQSERLRHRQIMTRRLLPARRPGDVCELGIAREESGRNVTGQLAITPLAQMDRKGEALIIGTANP